MNTYVLKMAPRMRANAPVMFMNGVSSRRWGGRMVATGIAVAGSTAYPGDGSAVVAMSTTLRSVVPTTAPAARTGQRSFWKYVSIATASARTPAPMKYRSGNVPAPAYSGRLRTRNVNRPARNRHSAKL
jgi:hypothetical protein